MPTDYGTSLDVVKDIPLTPQSASGMRNLANAIVRRLTTPRGGLAYAPDYGFDVRDLLNETVTPSFVAATQDSIAREVEKDERVLTCSAQLVSVSGRVTIALAITPVQGVAFSFVLKVDQLTLEILNTRTQP